jgi:hypothetical protein
MHGNASFSAFVKAKVSVACVHPTRSKEDDEYDYEYDESDDYSDEDEEDLRSTGGSQHRTTARNLVHNDDALCLLDPSQETAPISYCHRMWAGYVSISLLVRSMDKEMTRSETMKREAS